MNVMRKLLSRLGLAPVAPAEERKLDGPSSVVASSELVSEEATQTLDSGANCKAKQRKSFHRLKQTGSSFFFTGKSAYVRHGTLKPSTVDRVFDFAYEMAFTDKHRNSRSGGDVERTNAEIFANTFQGKIAECAACNFFYKFDPHVAPDFKTYEKGKWDTVDIAVCGKQVAIKSTKYYGQLLLLETKDWDSHGRYIPNIGESVCSYDYLLFIRVSPSCEDLLKEKGLLKCEHINEQELYHICCTIKWEYNYAGYITYDELVHIIREKYILPKHSLLNGKTRMDAENYYVQAVDMRPLSMLDNLN